MVLGTKFERTTVLTRQDWRVTDPEGWGGQGAWKLRVAQPGTWKVILRWPQPVQAAELLLQADGITAAGRVGEGDIEAVIGEVRLPRGNLDLLIAVRREGQKEEGPYQVFLERLD